MTVRPPRSPLFPYTTLFRSDNAAAVSRIAGSASAMARAARGRPVMAKIRNRTHCGQGLRRSEEHTSELQSRVDLVCRLLLEKKKQVGLIAARVRADLDAARS